MASSRTMTSVNLEVALFLARQALSNAHYLTVGTPTADTIGSIRCFLACAQESLRVANQATDELEVDLYLDANA